MLEIIICFCAVPYYMGHGLYEFVTEQLRSFLAAWRETVRAYEWEANGLAEIYAERRAGKNA